MLPLTFQEIGKDAFDLSNARHFEDATKLCVSRDPLAKVIAGVWCVPYEAGPVRWHGSTTVLR